MSLDVIEKINQHIISYNLNYRSDFTVKLTACKVVAIRKGSLLHGFHGKKKRKEKRKYSNSTKSNGSSTCAASHFAVLYFFILTSHFRWWDMMESWVLSLAYSLLPSEVKCH